MRRAASRRYARPPCRAETAPRRRHAAARARATHAHAHVPRTQVPTATLEPDALAELGLVSQSIFSSLQQELRVLPALAAVLEVATAATVQERALRTPHGAARRQCSEHERRDARALSTPAASPRSPSPLLRRASRPTPHSTRPALDHSQPSPWSSSWSSPGHGHSRASRRSDAACSSPFSPFSPTSPTSPSSAQPRVPAPAPSWACPHIGGAILVACLGSALDIGEAGEAGEVGEVSEAGEVGEVGEVGVDSTRQAGRPTERQWHVSWVWCRAVVTSASPAEGSFTAIAIQPPRHRLTSENSAASCFGAVGAVGEVGEVGTVCCFDPIEQTYEWHEEGVGWRRCGKRSDAVGEVGEVDEVASASGFWTEAPYVGEAGLVTDSVVQRGLPRTAGTFPLCM